MSVTVYLGKRNRELRMPKEEGKDWGLVSTGNVLSGRKSVERAQEENRVLTLVERYEDVDDYDPVLRWHCRS